jgi:PIN domain nuclease of toxin-antitoxin system
LEALKLLLDTHVLVWAESQEESLGLETKALLLNPLHTLHVSPISTFELSRLISLSRLTLHKSLTEWFGTARRNLMFEDATLSHEVAIESYNLPGDFHKDPADRILVATARVRGYTLLTADDLILAYPHVASLDARR